MWKNSKSDCKRTCAPDWVKGVQKYYDDIIEAFNKFPESLLGEANLVKTTFKDYLTKLVDFSNSKSTVLSSGSTAILGVLGTVKLSVNSPDGVIKEFQRVLPFLTKTYKGVVLDLSKIIGEQLSCSVNKAMTDLETAYQKYMTEFLQGDAGGFKKEVDYEPITKRAEAFKKVISQASVTQKCELATPNRLDASTVLGLILDHLIICYHGLSGCSKAILYEKKC